MQMDDILLRSEEKVVFKLRDIYRKHGYSCFKMSKFEEYDLYSQNKDFLVSDSVITFNDTNGKLMALKPDVTLSIVKNFTPSKGAVQRLYYNENVYRISDKTHNYKEIMQAGLECIGDITEYNIYEVVGLAAKSLETISKNCVLNISHLGVLTALLDRLGANADKNELISCIGNKNENGIAEICAKCDAGQKTTEMLTLLAEAYGDPTEIIEKFKALTDDESILSALYRLKNVVEQVSLVSSAKVQVDLSLTSDTNYYNGIMLQGFVEGIPTGVLSGGQYDRLMKKMGKPARAIGFAVYLDLLERLKAKTDYDVDVLLVYDKKIDPVLVSRRVAELINEGKSVSAQTTVPEKLLYREKEVLTSTEE